MNPTWQEIAQKIKAIMKEKKLFQKQVSEKYGSNQGSLCRTLKSKDVNYSTLVNICNALEINLGDLLN